MLTEVIYALDITWEFYLLLKNATSITVICIVFMQIFLSMNMWSIRFIYQTIKYYIFVPSTLSVYSMGLIPVYHTLYLNDAVSAGIAQAVYKSTMDRLAWVWFLAIAVFLFTVSTPAPRHIQACIQRVKRYSGWSVQVTVHVCGMVLTW
jgi:hypothetical protein